MIVGYLCSAKRRLPEADTLVANAILHRAIRTFQDEGKANSFSAYHPYTVFRIKNCPAIGSMSFGFRAVYRNRLFNKPYLSPSGVCRA